jgi:hypothetical protein
MQFNLSDMPSAMEQLDYQTAMAAEADKLCAALDEAGIGYGRDEFGPVALGIAGVGVGVEVACNRADVWRIKVTDSAYNGRGVIARITYRGNDMGALATLIRSQAGE